MLPPSPNIIPPGSARPEHLPEPQAVIEAVAPGSLAAAWGLEPGDRLLTVNGYPPQDVIDYLYHTARDRITLRVEKPRGEVWECAGEKETGEELGLHFAQELFTPLRRCNNQCLFCFVDQNPPGLRPTLYLKDDDYRLSFLHGYFITLTNLTEAHFERIRAQRLSPLYVSVHTTNPALRPYLFGNPQANAGWVWLRRLCAAGIEVHAQLVLCPGLNDGPELERSLRDLAALRPQLLSVAVVPVGLTKYQRHPNLRPYTQAEARGVLAQLETWQARSKRESDCNWVYAADEFFFLARRRLPPAEYYDDFPQMENGVGLTRLFLDDLATLTARRPRRSTPPPEVTLVTGELGARVLGDFFARENEKVPSAVTLVPVRNEFFGPTVTVAGLLAGQDILTALRGRRLGDWVLVPGAALNEEGLFLDDLSLSDLEQALGLPVRAARTAGELIAALHSPP